MEENDFWINEEQLNFFKEWYDEKIKVIKDPYEGFTLLNRTPKAGEIFMVDDITDKLWELGCIYDNGDIKIVQQVKEDKKTGFIPPFEIRTINPKKHRFWVMLTSDMKCL